MNDDPHIVHRSRNPEYQKTSSNNDTGRSNNSNSNSNPSSLKNKVVSNSKTNQDSNSSGEEDKERKNNQKRRNHASTLDSTLKKKNYIVNNDDEESENESPRILSRNQYSNSINRHPQKNNENYKSNVNTNTDNKDADKSNLQATSANRRNKSVNQHPKHNGASNELNKFKDSERNNTNNGNNNDREKGRERNESNHHRSSSDAGKHRISENLSATTNFNTNENKTNRKLTQSLIKPLIPEESDSPPPPPSQRRKNNHNNDDNNYNNNTNQSRNKRNDYMKKRYHDNEVVTLQCSLKPIVVEHYFIESCPQPFNGHLISKCNGRTMKSNIKHEETLQYVSEIIPGPTYFASLKKLDQESNQYQNNKRDKNGMIPNSISNSNMKLGKVNRFTTSTSSLISQNSEQVDADKDKRPKRSKSVSQKADVLVQNLFNEDDPISYYDFDFATVFTNSISDETTEELLPTINSFPSVKKLASLQINYDGDPKVVISKLVSPFQSDDQPDQQDFLSLTKTASTSIKKGEIVMSTVRRQRLIESISSSAFTEFRFGAETTEFAPDRLHIFTWHNLGIPTSLISKNLILVFQNYRGPTQSAPNLETLVKAITQYIAIWVRYFPKDFDDFSTCADFVLQLLKTMATKCRSCISFINVVGLLISDIYNKTIDPEDVYPPIKEPIYKDLATVNHLIDLSLDPYVMAQHFAYIDLCLLHKLQRSEFVNNNWMKVQEQMNKIINLNGNVTITNKDTQVNNFQVFLQRFNDTASFIAASILIDTEKRRARNISYWIKMMYHARKVKNYHLLAIIDAGLSCLPVKRLKDSWRLVNDNALIAFHRLHNFFKNEQNQREMLVDPKNSIPFIGIFLSQLSMIDIDSTKVLMSDNYQNNSQEVRAYNLNVQRKCFNIIDQIFYPWGVDIDFELDDKILKECKKLTGKAKHPKDLIMPSISFEPLKNDEKEVFADFLPHK